MAKLIGPLFSVDARGSVGDALTYAKTGKTNYAKRYTRPTNPQTAAQTAHRLGIGFISSLWKTLSVEQKATWNELADQLQLPPYHAFLKTNCKLWVRDEGITHVWPRNDLYPPNVGVAYPTFTRQNDYPNPLFLIAVDQAAEPPGYIQIALGPDQYGLTLGRLQTILLLPGNTLSHPWAQHWEAELNTPSEDPSPLRYHLRVVSISGGVTYWQKQSA